MLDIPLVDLKFASCRGIELAGFVRLDSVIFHNNLYFFLSFKTNWTFYVVRDLLFSNSTFCPHGAFLWFLYGSQSKWRLCGRPDLTGWLLSSILKVFSVRNQLEYKNFVLIFNFKGLRMFPNRAEHFINHELGCIQCLHIVRP